MMITYNGNVENNGEVLIIMLKDLCKGGVCLFKKMNVRISICEISKVQLFFHYIFCANVIKIPIYLFLFIKFFRMPALIWWCAL